MQRLFAVLLGANLVACTVQEKNGGPLFHKVEWPHEYYGRDIFSRAHITDGDGITQAYILIRSVDTRSKNIYVRYIPAVDVGNDVYRVDLVAFPPILDYEWVAVDGKGNKTAHVTPVAERRPRKIRLRRH